MHTARFNSGLCGGFAPHESLSAIGHGGANCPSEEGALWRDSCGRSVVRGLVGRGRQVAMSASQVASMEDKVTFRSITPVFNYPPAGRPPFVRSGRYRGAEFEISLKWYPPGKEGFEALTKCANEHERNGLQSIHLCHHAIRPATNWFLVVELVQPLSEDLKVSSNTVESVEVLRSAIAAIRLHSPKGLSCHHTYQYRTPSAGAEGSLSPPLISGNTNSRT